MPLFKSVTVKSAGSRLGSLVFFLNRYRSGGPIINHQISTHIEKCPLNRNRSRGNNKAISKKSQHLPVRNRLLTSRFLFKEREKITV
jgi:hypothetical protein